MGGEGFIGCRAKTLYNCYKDIKNAVYCYKTDSGGSLCRFGETLLASGKCCQAELFEFADVLGINRIETDFELGTPSGWGKATHIVLFKDCIGGEDIPFGENLKHCFEIISAADADFSHQAEYLYWLSDIKRRQGKGFAKAYSNDYAAALVSAADEKSAYLSSVAVLPKYRGRGLAGALLNAVLCDNMLLKKRIYVAAQQQKLTEFYQKNGFAVTPQFLTIAKRSK